MTDKKEEQGKPPAYSPWTIILAAGQLPMTAEQRYNYDRRLQRGFRAELPSYDPADLLDMDKVPWPGED